MSIRRSPISNPRSSAPVVLVTGAAGRLGAAIATALATRGAALLLVDQNERALADVRDSLSASGPLGEGSTEAMVADVSSRATAADAIARALTVFGRLDALVNNAGLEGPVARVEDVDLADVRRLFDVNVFALLGFSQVAVRHFRTQHAGRIVNVASGAGLAGSGLMAPYSASKHAVVGLTRSIAKEVAGDGIQVNAVCPGCVDSPMMERIEALLGELEGQGPVSFIPDIPAGRYCDPAEVGELVAYLTLEAPAYVTGSVLVIDGGLRA